MFTSPKYKLMKVSYFHVADDVPDGLEPDTAVVIDVLRATTTIAWALNNGAEAIAVFADIDQLRTQAGKWPESSRLLLGERGGKRLPGFDLGNSPVDVLPSLVSGKRVFMSTTNGTRSLNRVRNSKMLYTLALPNRKAVAERLLRENPDHVLILGSGWEGSYSLEDSLAAGSLGSYLIQKSKGLVSVVNDELTAAIGLWEQWKESPEACLRKSTHGQRLSGIGNHDSDFICCAALDELSIVPMQKEIGVLVAS